MGGLSRNFAELGLGSYFGLIGFQFSAYGPQTSGGGGGAEAPKRVLFNKIILLNMAFLKPQVPPQDFPKTPVFLSSLSLSSVTKL